MRQTLRAVFAALASLCFTSAAHAALGSTPTPAATLNPNVPASVSVQPATGYTISVTTFSDGVVVHEYVATNGTVFAVSWSGPIIPNVTALLGSYFTQVQQGIEDYHRAHGGMRVYVVDQPNLHADGGGLPGAFHGRAYLPNALPAGVTAATLQ